MGPLSEGNARILLLLLLSWAAPSRPEQSGGGGGGSNSVISPPSISVLSGEVTEGGGKMWYEEAWAFATAEWWRVAVLVASLTILLCLCCYLTRCCYLCWDCCTDPFWGYCPRCDGLESCLKLQCCCRRRGEDMRAYYEIDLQDNKSDVSSAQNGTRRNSSKRSQRQNQERSEEEDMMVQVEMPQSQSSPPPFANGGSVGVDAVRSGGRKASRSSNASSGSGRHRRRNRPSDADSKEPESMPQVYDEERYFNVLHLCGMGKGGDGKGKHPNGGVRGQEIEEEEAIISFSGKDANGSRISMDKRDIVIEHGHAGRYQQLPEARSEWVPLQLLRRGPRASPSEDGGDKRLSNRLSRSMESFGARHLASPNGHLQQQQQQQQKQQQQRTAISTSHADIAVGTDPRVFSCNKYSQTDLDRDLDPNDRLDFRLQRPVVPMPAGAAAGMPPLSSAPGTYQRPVSSASGRIAAGGGINNNGFPPPKAPRSAAVIRTTAVGGSLPRPIPLTNGSHHHHHHHRNGGRANFDGGFSSSSVSAVAPHHASSSSSPPPSDVERQILFGKETNILS